MAPYLFALILAAVAGLAHADDHIIEPEQLPEYIQQFQQQQNQVRLVLEQSHHSLSFVDMDMEEQTLYLSFDQGLIIAELSDELKGERELVILMGDPTKLDRLLDHPERVLVDEEAQLSEEEGNWIYRGTLEDEENGQLSPFTLVLNDSVLEAGNSTLTVAGSRAILRGDLGVTTYLQLHSLIRTHPEVTELVFQDVPGSLFDGINLHSGRLVRQAGLTTVMPSDGEAYSGGVDLFLAGAKRVYQPGGKLGVHSWCCEEEKGADELPKSHPAHNAQLTFVREMLGPELGPEFYFYTLDAAPFDNVHLMSHDEIRHYLKPQPF